MRISDWSSDVCSSDLAMNALHSAVHFELHEIWDAYERDPDLWVAIVTGAGERAFCSGNDLKVTAKGGDMSIPPSGFAGLCARFDRAKPVIAAVNGVAIDRKSTRLNSSH